MSYPSSIPTFTTKTDGVDYPQAEHINTLQTNLYQVMVALATNFGASPTTGDTLTWSGTQWVPRGLTGWTEVTDAWTYASATTITVPSGAASLYQKGDALRIKQGAGYKYYYIITVADTLLTVTGGTDYTVANSAITDIAINRTANPFGHPIWFDTGTITVTVSTMDDGAGGQPTTATSRFFINGNRCTHKMKVTGTKATTNKVITYTNPSNMPAHTEANLVSLGSGYIGNVDFVAVLITQTSTTRTLLSADSITDNQSLAGGVTAIYTYEF